MTGSCACEDGSARFDQFEARPVGRDETSGLFAEVEIWRCRTCGRPWLRYSMEQEAFSRSGRWTRGLVTDAEADAVTAGTAGDVLGRLAWRLEGGSYHSGQVSRLSGRLNWSAQT